VALSVALIGFWTHAATVISFYVRPSRIVGRYRDEEVGTGSDMFQFDSTVEVDKES